MAYLYGIWGCFIAFAVSALGRLIVVRRIRTELAVQASTSPGETISDETFMELLKHHKSRFPASSTRALSNALIVVQMVAAGTGAVLIIVAQFQPHSMFHLIAGR
jgi:hypothetical protein